MMVAELPGEVPAGPFDLETVQADLAARLAAALDDIGETAAASAPPVAPGRFDPTDHPRIVEGLVVPATSVFDDDLASWILLPVGECTSVGLTGRAVGVAPRAGRWQPVWIGDDRDERTRVFNQFAADLGHARRFHR